MFRQIWQRILNLWQQIQRRFRKPVPPAPKPTPIRTFGEYEQKFLQLLEGVEQGWSRGDIKGFLIGCKIKDAEWENWLQEFGDRLLVSPETHLELGGRMVRLGEMNCGKISEVAGKTGRQLLPQESLNPTPVEESSQIREDIQELPEKTEETGFFPVSGGVAESIEIEISQEAEELYNQGVDRYYAGDLEGAIAAFEKALEIDAKYYLAWNGLGKTLKDLGRYIEAIAAYEKALEIYPTNSLIWELLGATLNYLHHYNEAITAYNKALEIDPRLYHAWYNLGNTLIKLNRNIEAIAAYEKALEIKPKDYHTWQLLGIILNHLRRYNEAIAAFEKALEITGDQQRMAWLHRGWAFFNSGRYIEAIQNWDEGLQKYLSSNHDYRLAWSDLHQQKGYAHYKHGKQTATYLESFHKAKASYEQAREFLKLPLIPETYLEVMQGLITVCRSLGDPKTSEYLTEATTVLENLILDNDTPPEIKLRLQRKFAGLYQLEVDTLVESGNKINALEKAEARKNFCLQWMRAGLQNPTDSPTYPQIRDLLANNTETAIIYWHLSPVSLTAFIITLEKFEVICTPVTDIFAKRHSQSLEKWLKDWKTNYQNYGQTTSKQQSKESHPWRESMTAQLQQLADILKIPEICTHLTNIQHLILIPHRDLHLLPLDSLFLPPFPVEGVGTGALPLRNPGRGNPPVVAPIIGTGALPLQNPGRGNPPVVAPIIRRITRLPSAQIAIQQQQQNSTEIAPNSLLMVEHSQGKSALKFTQIEAAAIKQINQTHRASNATTKTAIIEALKANSGIFHYTGHAYHNTEKSEASALMLAKDEELTLTDILQLKLVNYYLVCLSACETGITKKGELIDEFVGIASGFLPETNYIISTLWRVDERSSALLMIYFYQLWKQGMQPPEALQQAKDWLRELTNGKLGEWYAGELLPLLREANFKSIFFFEMEASRLQENLAKIEEKPYNHPYHWAAFTITGNG
ncbi:MULTISPECIES: CHAT domain-containing tetratricopeptide repeat protein [unclassified Microcoleus]|uniref:CHAT domain-containing tetratricopeptide repeat protein n=1 Tax=unclassified Microcoleus TaxID=2642155 RepID=UPI002FD0D0B6